MVQQQDGLACGRAMSARAPILVDDITCDAGFAAHREIVCSAGVRAVHSTSLLGRDGTVLGVLSTHFRNPHQLSRRQLQRLEPHVRAAAERIERCLPA